MLRVIVLSVALLSGVMLSVTALSAAILSVFMLSVFVLSIITLSAFVLNVPEGYYAERHYSVCLFTEYRYAEGSNAEWCNA